MHIHTLNPHALSFLWPEYTITLTFFGIWAFHEYRGGLSWTLKSVLSLLHPFSLTPQSSKLLNHILSQNSTYWVLWHMDWTTSSGKQVNGSRLTYTFFKMSKHKKCFHLNTTQYLNEFCCLRFPTNFANSNNIYLGLQK